MIVKEIKKFKKYEFKIGYKCEWGVFCFEEDNLIIVLDEFFIKKLFCKMCKVGEKYFVSNKICWVIFIFLVFIIEI